MRVLMRVVGGSVGFTSHPILLAVRPGVRPARSGRRDGGCGRSIPALRVRRGCSSRRACCESPGSRRDVPRCLAASTLRRADRRPSAPELRRSRSAFHTFDLASVTTCLASTTRWRNGAWAAAVAAGHDGNWRSGARNHWSEIRDRYGQPGFPTAPLGASCPSSWDSPSPERESNSRPTHYESESQRSLSLVSCRLAGVSQCRCSAESHQFHSLSPNILVEILVGIE